MTCHYKTLFVHVEVLYSCTLANKITVENIDNSHTHTHTHKFTCMNRGWPCTSAMEMILPLTVISLTTRMAPSQLMRWQEGKYKTRVQNQGSMHSCGAANPSHPLLTCYSEGQGSLGWNTDDLYPTLKLHTRLYITIFNFVTHCGIIV